MKRFFAFVFVAFVCHAQEMKNQPTVLDNDSFTFVALTPTNVILKATSRGDGLYILGPDMNEYLREHNKHLKREYSDSWWLKGNTEFTIPLDKEVTFSDGRHFRMIYMPVLLANQQKGFRVVELYDNRRSGYDAIISHIALSDSPKQVDESEVVMILENGEWMNIEDAESLEDLKSRWKIGFFILLANSSMEHPVTIARLSTNAHYGPLWAPAIAKGWITPNAEMRAALIKAGYLPPNEKLDEETPLVVPEEPAQENENALPPPCRPARRSWLWWLALPVVAVAWLVFHLIRKE